MTATILAASALWIIGCVADPAATSPAVGRQVTEQPTPPTSTVHGASAGYAVWGLRGDGTPIRWNPCQPIHLAVNDQYAPHGWRDDLHQALERLNVVTVIDFELSDTNERPSPQRPMTRVARDGSIDWAPVLIAWSGPDATLSLQPWDRAVALPIAAGSGDAPVFVTGQIVFNHERDHRRVTTETNTLYGPALHTGWADRSTSWGPVILHELGHLLGLDHVDDPDQIMSAAPGEGPVAFGHGDAAGLAAVAGNRDCLDVPAAALAHAQRR